MDRRRPEDLPIIDVAPLVAGVATAAAPTAAELVAARQIDAACRSTGFFLIEGHGAPQGDLERLDRAARAFFALDEATKAELAMERGGRAWRGWFPEGGELTDGRPDRKEGLYFGRDLPATDRRVVAGLPLHGPNLYPARPAELRPSVDAWMAAMERVGHALVRGVGLGLGLAPAWFDDHLTADPTILFRIFRYPSQSPDDVGWGVAEHTDYGLLTLLAHDGTPGLQVHSGGRWIDVPAVQGTVVVNLGDMVERMTAGSYRSTPHRVRHLAADESGDRDRLSFPFFFDPAFDAQVQPVPQSGSTQRWEGTYGDYLVAKVTKVFPALGAAVLAEGTDMDNVTPTTP